MQTVTLSMDMSPRLGFHLPYSRYLILEECWSKIKAARNISEDQKYKPVTCIFDATVVTVPRDLHKLASQGANASVASRILHAGSTTTQRQADGTIKYTRPGAKHEAMIAMEVGYSEHYAALCREKDAWIDGKHVKVCILVCLDESPRIRNPRTRHENVGDVIGEWEEMVQAVTETVEWDTSLGYYGQIEYQGHQWVGNLKEALIEVWRAKKMHPTRYVSRVIELNSRVQP
ncbi:hypothetical protein V1515DRAFT_616631 [Lipomyces mesembrius]